MAAIFAEDESCHDEASLYGVTDGKAVGTYLEQKFTIYLSESYSFKAGSSAYQTTKGLLEILQRDGNKDDIIAFIVDRNLPVDEIVARQLADKILDTPPNQGYLTISNALQWRLQYSRVIKEAGQLTGISKVR